MTNGTRRSHTDATRPCSIGGPVLFAPVPSSSWWSSMYLNPGAFLRFLSHESWSLNFSLQVTWSKFLASGRAPPTRVEGRASATSEHIRCRSREGAGDEKTPGATHLAPEGLRQRAAAQLGHLAALAGRVVLGPRQVPVAEAARVDGHLEHFGRDLPARPRAQRVHEPPRPGPLGREHQKRALGLDAQVARRPRRLAQPRDVVGDGSRRRWDPRRLF
mmetsp:Transcript_5776/g.17054  ORF Transcript_5776/g.17054 Transcript_5776/m.17054 type:complete len:217 (-) Transcript_5776:236-886(-)